LSELAGSRVARIIRCHDELAAALARMEPNNGKRTSAGGDDLSDHGAIAKAMAAGAIRHFHRIIPRVESCVQ